MRSALLLAITAVPFLGADALKISTTARCGIQSSNKLTCKSSAFGDCCSKSGYCGSTSAYCGTGCQAGFGDCKSTAVKSSSAPARPSTTTTKSSSTSSARAIAVSIQRTAASSVVSASKPSSSAATTPSPSASVGKISTDGTCGGDSGFTCSGSAFGNCCSQYGWCGSTSGHCDAGCNAAFGNCNAGSGASSSPVATPSSPVPSSFITSTKTSSAVPSPTNAISTNGQCGAPSGGLTCLGSQFGDCCSQYNYCGSTTAFCQSGCQPGFGNCDPTPAPTTICGVEGFANKTSYYASSFGLFDTQDISTCAALCLAEPTCLSYLFNPLLGNCAYLPQSLAQGEFIATADTDQFFWDRACAETKGV